VEKYLSKVATIILLVLSKEVMEVLKLALSAKLTWFALEIEMINLHKLFDLLSKFKNLETKKPFTTGEAIQY
jgi:hypothetical protein